MQGLRRQGRAYALQLLYQIDISGQRDETVQELFWKESKASPRARAFGEELVQGTLKAQERIDALLSEALENWKMSRLPVIVRNVLRLAACELLVIGSEPHPVVINEALELLREYMDEESAKFANGVLDKIRQTGGEPGKKAAEAPGEPTGSENRAADTPSEENG